VSDTNGVRHLSYSGRMAESCWRCGAEMLWVQSTWQCPRCKWKLGCCEGDPQTACEVEVPARVAPWQSSKLSI
jgi:hypothetical protein